MKYSFFFICTLLIINIQCLAQGPSIEDLQKIAAGIEEEGLFLYRSEFASWYGTDLFLEKYKSDRAEIGGYFSYPSKSETKCIFFSKDESPKIIGTITFDTTYNAKSGVVDLTVRDFTEKEEKYYKLRKLAKEETVKNDVFKFYKNSNYNIVPVIRKGKMKVYIMTGATENNKTLFGNDYQVNFDENYKITSVEPLHRTLMSVDCPVKGENMNKVISYAHTHLPEFSPYITPTDICIGMLYQKYLDVEEIMVVSKDYISIWKCEYKKLIILPMSMYKAIGEQQDKH